MNKQFALNLLLLVFITFFIITCSSPTDPPPPNQKPDTTSQNIQWEIDTIGSFQTNLNDVWASSPDNVYAVGIIVTSLSPFSATNIMHWDGTKWSPVDYLEGTLRSIHGFSHDDIWCVGNWRVDQNSYALIAHWDGSTWHTWKMEEYGTIFSLWGTSSYNLYVSGDNGVILHYDGASWKEINTPTDLSLRGIWGIEGGPIYAVGGSFQTGVGVLLKQTETGEWEKIIERAFRPDSLSGVLSSVWAAEEDRFYVKSYVGNNHHWQQAGWPYDNTFIDRIYGSAENNIFAVGSFGLIMHYNGSTFMRYDEFYRKPNGDLLNGIWAGDDNVFVVGRSEAATGIVYRGKQR